MLARGWRLTKERELCCSRRMLKKPASFVLDSLKSSTETRPPHHSAARTDMVLLIRRTVRPRGCASGFDSPAALLDSLFEHPAWLLFEDELLGEAQECPRVFPSSPKGQWGSMIWRTGIQSLLSSDPVLSPRGSLCGA